MNISGLWDQLVDCICRPPRYTPGFQAGVIVDEEDAYCMACKKLSESAFGSSKESSGRAVNFTVLITDAASLEASSAPLHHCDCRIRQQPGCQ